MPVTDRSTRVVMITALGYTGLAYFVYSLLESLQRFEGVRVTLLTSQPWVVERFAASFPIEFPYRGCSGPRNRLIKGLFFCLSTARVAWRVARSGARIVHLQHTEFPLIDLALMLGLRFLRKRIVFTPHDIVHHKHYALARSVSRVLFALSDRIIVHGSDNRQRIEREFGVPADRIRCIPAGGCQHFTDAGRSREAARDALGLDRRHPIVLFFGDIRPGKGLDVLLRAMPRLRDQIPDLRLLIAGRPSHGLTPEWVYSRVAETGAADRTVLRLGFVPTDQAADHYLASDLVILPYTEISNSGVLRFAQTFARPVLCSDLPVLRENVTHRVNGLLFRAGDAEDLARQAEAFFAEPDLARLGDAGRREMLRTCSWERIAALTREVYAELDPHYRGIGSLMAS